MQNFSVQKATKASTHERLNNILLNKTVINTDPTNKDLCDNTKSNSPYQALSAEIIFAAFYNNIYSYITSASTFLKDNNLTPALIFSVTAFIYGIYQKKSSEIENQRHKLSQSIFRANEIKDDIKSSYDDAYTIIKKEERVNILKLKKITQ